MIVKIVMKRRGSSANLLLNRKVIDKTQLQENDSLSFFFKIKRELSMILDKFEVMCVEKNKKEISFSIVLDFSSLDELRNFAKK